MSKANEVLSNPNFVTDARETMAQLRVASAKVSKMAQTIDKLLSRKHPLMHMLFSSTFNNSEKSDVDSDNKQSDATQGKGKEKVKKTQVKQTEQVEIDASSQNLPQSDEAVPMHGEL